MVMPQGLQVFDSSGNMMLDVTDRLTRYLGAFDTGSGNGSGSYTDALLLTGTPWIIVTCIAGDPAYLNVAFTVSGSTISWSMSQILYTTGWNFHVLYGVY